MRFGPWIVMVAGCRFSDPGASSDARAIDASAGDGLAGDAAEMIWIEAELYDATTTSAAGHQWLTRTDQPMYSAASFMQLVPANGGACAVVADLATCAASLSYNVSVAVSGMYFLHVRILATRNDEDSIFVGIDDLPDPNAIDQAEDGTWKWETRGPYSLAAGAHRLRLWQREAGIRVDVLALSERATPPS
jgi:hypothetical protein